MIDENSVMSTLKREYRLRDTPEAELRGICRGVCIQLENDILPKADRRDMRLIYLAAAKAYRKLVFRLIASEDEISSFRAGDVAITQNPTASAALTETILCDALQAAAPLLRDREFAFMRVKA